MSPLKNITIPDEVVPGKFGGSPVNINSKIFLDGNFHRQRVTPFWNKIMDFNK